MDISLVIRQRLNELGRDQKDLAAAAQVTDSYISQLLARKKAPPAPGRTDIYEKIGGFLGLPPGELSKLAEAQRRQELRKKVAEPPAPLYRECRGLILRKCEPARRDEIRRIFEKDPFGELERLVTQKLLDVVQGVAILEFPDTDISHVSPERCVSFLDPAIDSWDIDLKTLGIEVVLNRRLTPGGTRRFEFVEKSEELPFTIEPGFEQFLRDKTLSRDATEPEIEFLKALKFQGRRPAALYYYRELQSLRDPLHFPPGH